jgi:hypothetical protein
VKRFVHVWPLSVECQIAALPPLFQLELKALITISLGLAGLTAMLV